MRDLILNVVSLKFLVIVFFGLCCCFFIVGGDGDGGLGVFGLGEGVLFCSYMKEIKDVFKLDVIRVM